MSVLRALGREGAVCCADRPNEGLLQLWTLADAAIRGGSRRHVQLLHIRAAFMPQLIYPRM